jgi:uncharacterized protein (TIGR02271 family)
VAGCRSEAWSQRERRRDRTRSGARPSANIEKSGGPMITMEQVDNVLGREVYDSANAKIGKAEHVYFDQQTRQPEWLTVRTGLFGKSEAFVPLQPAELRGDGVMVPFSKDQVRNAPHIDVANEEELPQADEARIYEYYGMRRMPTEEAAPKRQPRGDEAMTRSEEHLRVGKQDREAGRVRLRKYVTVEEEQQTVPVRKERVRVEREPITKENVKAAKAGPDIREAEHEVILHEERPVVETETVPVERVRLERETVTEEEKVSGQVRKEHIDTEGDTSKNR